MIKMKIEFDNGSKKEIEFEGEVLELFKILKLNYEEYIVSRKGEILLNDDILKNSDEILLISVVSGG